MKEWLVAIGLFIFCLCGGIAQCNLPKEFKGGVNKRVRDMEYRTRDYEIMRDYIISIDVRTKTLECLNGIENTKGCLNENKH